MRQRRERTGSPGWTRLIAVLGGAVTLALALAAAVPTQAAASRQDSTALRQASAVLQRASVVSQRAGAARTHITVNCGDKKSDSSASNVQCPDVYNPVTAFGHYVGHDEAGAWFDSNVPGSGNRARWQVTLPTDPPPSSVPGKRIYTFEEHVAFWFGMDLCASQSYPEQLSTCTPDSNSNIVNPKVSAEHTGSAYLELQFYPPGYTPFPSGVSCDARHWCAAMNVWSYYYDPVTGDSLNTSCQNTVGGSELDNFAFVSRDGKPAGPPNPLLATNASFTPNSETLLMNQGDKVGVTIEDSPLGLTVQLADHMTHQSGTMTASAANGFAQMVFAPSPSTQCTSTPYTFRPMYSTSTPQTRSTWTAYP
jgi:hypothetical protein